MNSLIVTQPRRAVIIALLSALALLVALLFLSPGMSDVPTFWLAWMGLATKHGVISGYRLAASDYPPLSHLMLAIMADFGRACGLSALLSLKVASTFGLFAVCAIVWEWTRRVDYAALLGLALVIPTLGLGYIDIFFAPALLISFWTLAEKRFGIGMAFFVLAVFIKWQPLIFAPFFFIYLCRNLPPAKALLFILGLPVAALIVAVAFYGDAVMLSWRAATHHSVLSGAAINLPWVCTFLVRVFKPSVVGGLIDGRIETFSTAKLIYNAPFKLLFAGFYGFLLYRAWKVPAQSEFANYLRLATLGFVAYFLFNTGVHENHLFAPLLASAALLYLAGESRLFVFCALFFNLDCILFYGVTGTSLIRVVGGVDLTLIAALVSCIWGTVLLIGQSRASQTAAPSSHLLNARIND